MRKLEFTKAQYDLWREDREFDSEAGPAAHQQARQILAGGRGYVTDAEEELYDIAYRRKSPLVP